MNGCGIYDGEKKEIRKCHRYAMLGNAVSVPVVAAVAGEDKGNHNPLSLWT